ncbi:phosphatidylserine decarboxylase [Lachnospiraceae bacterium]|nr:phosphatidylserine decarboxylase [Lachnospiraceae bacterium]
MQYFDRKKGQLFEEQEYGKEALEFLYNTVPGRILLKLFIARPIFSRIRARYYKSQKSVHEIVPFIEKYHVDMTGYSLDSFRTFNDFFTRKRRITDNSDDGELVSIADSRLSVYEITDDLKLGIKNTVYTLDDILQDKELSDKYRGGTCLVFRLCVDDYHRFHFIDEGRVISRYRIEGMLHTVRSISEKYHVYSSNTREVTVMDTEHFGQVTEIDVGALLVGCIRNRKVSSFHKLMEKGYFEYGGSTIVMLLQKGVEIDPDIIGLSKKEIECKVRIGEKIGRVKNGSGIKTT